MYTVATVEADGMIRVKTAPLVERVVHKESVAIHAWGNTCYSQLHVAKKHWPGPDSTSVILHLNDKTGACTAIWMGDAQRETLMPRLKRWAGCYGAWPIKKLNG